jgi:pimeloyl-ACP methyl ester carboxylesterase
LLTRIVPRALLVLGVGLVALHAGGRALLASAIADAPNHGRAAEPLDEPPAELSRYQARTIALPLAAWVLEPPAAPARATVFVLHGVRLDKRSMLPVAKALAESGMRAVVVDLRGHGASSGDYLTYGVADSRALSELVDRLAAGFPLGPVGVLGYSYGGAAAIQWAARDARVRAVVAVSAFSSLRAVVRDYLALYAPPLAPIVPGWWLDGAIDGAGSRAAFDPDEAAPAAASARSTAPMLIVHGAADRQVPADHAARLAEHAAGPVTTWILPNAGHADTLYDRRVHSVAIEWLERKL